MGKCTRKKNFGFRDCTASTSIPSSSNISSFTVPALSDSESAEMRGNLQRRVDVLGFRFFVLCFMVYGLGARVHGLCFMANFEWSRVITA